MENYEETNVRSRLRAYNELIEFKNALMPEVDKHCKEYGIKILKSGNLSSKNQTVIGRIIKETNAKFPERTDLRVYTLCSRHSARIEFSISYSRTDYKGYETWDYITQSVYLDIDREYKPQEPYNIDSAIEDYRRLSSLRHERDSLNSEIRRIVHLTIGR